MSKLLPILALLWLPAPAWASCQIIDLGGGIQRIQCTEPGSGLLNPPRKTAPQLPPLIPQPPPPAQAPGTTPPPSYAPPRFTIPDDSPPHWNTPAPQRPVSP